ncbi:hypothetical protein AWQ21_10310 [Picosynechococcus sp. PCC 7003]|uniref:FkbM family methyltransferase n=1 Tax=Picosynechococcus sp. PCC 7003 TaxID=374981 RepID=UPI0008106467|nr:FkbM family methyltransferase [Picosynechococcus sp. PCC 7003]ANV84735.1 hypothetical protein AWQ21_10310 [Picosynechococcus sp. PCC 7003]
MKIKHYLSVIKKHPKPIKFIVAKLLYHTKICRLLVINQDGYKLRFHPSNLACQLWINPEQRKNDLAFFNAYLKSGDYVIDVGANIGDTVLTASNLVGKNATVIAIEAHPRTFSFLIDNLKLNNIGNVITFNSAIGDMVGELEFSDNWRDDMNRVGKGSLKVSVNTLNNLITNEDEVALLKIDVEGYEKFVIDGANKILKNVKCIYFEVGEQHFSMYNYSIKDLLDLLEKHEFRLFKIVDFKQLSPINSMYKTDRVENLIALRELEDFVIRTAWEIIDS